MGKVDSVIEQIRKILKEDNRGLTIQELSEKAKTTRITASLALAKLEGSGVLDIRIIGNCKLHYLKQQGGRTNAK